MSDIMSLLFLCQEKIFLLNLAFRRTLGKLRLEDPMMAASNQAHHTTEMNRLKTRAPMPAP